MDIAQELTNLTGEGCDVREDSLGLTIAVSLLYGVVFVLALIGNIMVITIVYVRPKLRSASNVNLINLAFADLCCCVGLPFSLVSEIKSTWIFGDVVCVLVAFLTLWACTAIVMILLNISIYRYFVISRARSEIVKVLRKRTVRINVLVWSLSAVFSAPPIIGWGRYRACVGLPSCFLDLPSSRSYIIFFILFTTLIPSVLMIFCYARICATVRNSSKRVKNTAQALFRASTILTESVVSESGDTRRSRCSLRDVEFLPLPVRSHRGSDSGIIQASRSEKRLSIVSYTSVIANMRPEELRLGKSLFLVFVAYLLFWSPVVIIMFIAAFLNPTPVHGLWVAMQLCMYIHAAVNPFVYGLLTDPFRCVINTAMSWGNKTRAGIRDNGLKRPSIATMDRLNVESDTYMDRSNSDSKNCERINLKRLSIPESCHPARLSLSASSF
ncbi:5-hydroxytryptamine receptor 1D-like [Patiria miniata]|uniref:G-protein coupled receptors family 1 profile domain-containing protein n=1 Tax=Patiria miniata TaxID=46514 RepID=A0A914A447_PATMI|nr:5-hydroxytryptamine receptor 1D-like [Patiria miniata]